MAADASSSWPFKTPSNGCRQQITAGKEACSSLRTPSNTSFTWKGRLSRIYPPSFRFPCLNHLKTCPFIAWDVKTRWTITAEPLSSTWENQSYSWMELALIGASFWRNPGNIPKCRCATIVRPRWSGTAATGASLWGAKSEFLVCFLSAQDKTCCAPSQLLCVPWSVSFQPLFQRGVGMIIAITYEHLQTTKRAAAFNHIKSSFSHHLQILLHLPDTQVPSHHPSWLVDRNETAEMNEMLESQIKIIYFWWHFIQF